jgi:hypothetical protein
LGTVRFGDCKTPEFYHGVPFQLIIYTADARCDQAFKDYVAKGPPFKGITEEDFPAGCTEHTRIVVIRQ